MGAYKKAVITDAGRALVARAVAGETEIRFSHASTSEYVYPDGTRFEEIEKLEGIRQTVLPADARVADGTLVNVRAMFGNENILSPYMIQNIGLYAMDGEREILFAVSQAQVPDQVPAYNGVAPSSFIFNLCLAVAQAAEIRVTVDPAGTVTIQDILEIREQLRKTTETAEKAAGSLITGITIPASGWKDLTYTIENAAIQADSIVHIGYAFDSVPAAQKANIRGRTEAGKLILAAKKIPAGDLAVDEILIQNLKGGV